MTTEHNLASFVKRLPRRLQLRFESLGALVKAIATEQQESDARIGRRREPPSAEQLAFIQLLAFVYALDGFLRAGTRAAKGAATEFSKLGAIGFSVGETEFTPDNENTMRGEALANELKEAVRGTRYATLIEQAPTLPHLILQLLRDTERG